MSHRKVPWYSVGAIVVKGLEIPTCKTISFYLTENDLSGIQLCLKGVASGTGFANNRRQSITQTYNVIFIDRNETTHMPDCRPLTSLTVLGLV